MSTKGTEGAGESHYELMGLEPSATEEEIKAAYRVLALKLHPDRDASSYATSRFKAP